MLAHPSDLPFLEATLRHQLRHFAACTAISRRVVVADYSGAEAEGARRLRNTVAALVDEGALDAAIDVDWDPVTVVESMQRWFGRADTPPRAGRARPRCQYAHSLDVAERNLVLHLDSDVLFWGSLDWIEHAPQRFDESEQLLAIVPMAGPPQARTPREWILGPRAGRSSWPLGPNRSDSVTTRHVVFHRGRLAGLCPLDRRWGRPWDIATSGRGYLPWRFARAHPQRQSWGNRSERTPE